MVENQAFLLSDFESDTVSLESAAGSKRLPPRACSNRVRKKCNTIQQAIAETVEKNFCRRMTLGQACRDGRKDCVRKLLRGNLTNLNTLDADGFSPLHYATTTNHVDIVQMLLDAGADVDVRGSPSIQRIPPIICAAKFNAIESCRVLLRAGADVNITNCYGQTALHHATRRGHSKMVELLLRDGQMDVNVVDRDNTTSLHVAAMIGSNPIIKTLLFCGANITAKDNDGFTAFHLAAREGEEEVLQTLLRTGVTLKDTVYLDDTDNYGNTCLHLAVKHGRYSCVKTCMDAGASWSVWNSSLQTPLHLAAIAGNLCIVKLLILKGAKYDCEDGDGMTAILRASLEGHVDIVEHLLDQGAPLMCPDGKLTPTPLLCAVERCHHKTIEFLFSRGAPTDYQDMHWRTCLHVAAACSDFRTVEIILRNGGKSIINSKDSYGKTPLHYAVIRCQGGKIIQLLIESGANVLAVDFDERLPLHHAAEQGMLDNISILLQANPETINEVDNRSLTALHIAAAAARTEACRLLLEKGAEVDYRDDERLTPLFYVASVGCPLTVKVLLEYDADLEARDKNRKTPLISAAYFGRLEVFRTLLDSGADIAAETSSGWNALDVALDNNNLDITNEIIRHESWKTLLLNTKADGVSPLKKLIERVPCLAKVVLDKCIEHSTWVDTDKEYSVTYDFQLLSPPPDREKDKNGQRYFGPMEMLLHGREDLLRHPLTKKLMATKWRNVGVNFFYLGAFIYSLFLVDFSHFMFCVTGFNDKLRRNETEKSHMCSESMLYYQAITLAIFAIVNLLYEAYQLYTERLSYFEMANGFQVSTFVCTLIMLFPLEKNKFLVTELSWSAGMIGLLLAYLTFLLYLQTLFSTGIYVTMLFEVLKSLLKVLAMFSVLILGFALIFVLLMNGAEPFNLFLPSIFKVVVMTIGEIEYSRYFVDEVSLWSSRTKHLEHRELIAQCIFVCFCLLMPIALMNLLIGLAVGDIESVQEHAEMKMMATEIETVFEFEEKIPLVIRRRFYKPSMTIFPNKPRRFTRWVQKYFGCFGSRLNRRKKIGIKRDMTVNESPSDSLTNMQFTLADHGHRIDVISTELRAHRELLESIAAALHRTPSEPTNERNVRRQEGSEENILMKL